jgi:uncharacterized glyoxalase superfamily protein PhnB
MYWEKNGRGPSPWIGVWVDDLDALVARVRSHSVEIGEPVLREFGVRMSGSVTDPAGYVWGFMQRVSTPPPSSPV